MKMKRLASILLCACMLLTACGNSDSEPEENTNTTQENTTNTPTVVLQTEHKKLPFLQMEK